jgi:hypothetical protein
MGNPSHHVVSTELGEQRGEVPHKTASKTNAVIKTVHAATPPSTGFSSWITVSSNVVSLGVIAGASLVSVWLRDGPDGTQLLSSKCSTEVWIVDVAIVTKSLNWD